MPWQSGPRTPEKPALAVLVGLALAPATLDAQPRPMRPEVIPEDVGMYRVLAGGVTTINVLHGSANPIGAATRCSSCAGVPTPATC